MKMSKLLKILLLGIQPFYAADDDGAGTGDTTGGDDTTGGAGEGDDKNTGSDDTGDGEGGTGESSESDDTGDGEGTKEGDGDSDDNDEIDFSKLELPDGMELDQAAVDAFGPLMKGMTQDKAQEFATAFAGLKKAELDGRIEAFDRQKQDWYDACINDKEIGGDAFEENAALAVAAIEKFGTPELKTMLDNYGIGNNPELVRFMVKVGRATAEDNPGGGTGSTDSDAKKDHAEILYPSE